jgi:hypothetical protein
MRDHNAGPVGEMLVSRALEEVRLEKPEKLAQLGKTVDRFIHAKPNSPLDRMGIDFLAFLEDATKVFIQVKTSERKMAKFRHKMSKWKRLFLFLLVRVDESIESIKQRIVDGLMDMFDELQNHANLMALRNRDMQAFMARLSPDEKKARRLEIREERRALRQERKRWCYRRFAFSCVH